MSQTPPQVIHKCACPVWSSQRACVGIRYGIPANEVDEPCECECHIGWDAEWKHDHFDVEKPDA